MHQSSKDPLKCMLTADNREDYIERLRGLANSCTRCSLGRKSRQIRQASVLSKGNPYAKVMILAEAPGKDEVIAGSPLVGPSGRIWHQMLEELGIDHEKLYHTNTLLCKVNKDGGEGTLEEPVKACAPYLEHQIYLLRPYFIIALGATAMRRLGVTGSHSPLDEDITFGKYQKIAYSWVAHPAYVLRQMDSYDKVKEKLGKIFDHVQEQYNLDLNKDTGDIE